MKQKLGWLGEYASDLDRWNQCQEVLDRSLSVINLHGLDAKTEELVERSRLSTEILESLFGKYKQVERQHSKGGFTRLIAATPTLCVEATSEVVGQAF